MMLVGVVLLLRFVEAPVDVELVVAEGLLAVAVAVVVEVVDWLWLTGSLL